MGSGLTDMALAVFTTLAPMGACAFIVIAIALAKGGVDEANLRRLDKATLIPIVVCIAGFIGAALHVANPLAAVNVFAGVGRSPLSNEVAVGLAFLVLAVVYWLLSWKGALKGGARMGFAVVLAVAAIMFAAFCGMAYLIPTVPTWSTPWSVVQMLGFGLLGGGVLGVLTVRAGGVEVCGVLKTGALAVTAVGAVLAIVGFAGQAIAVADMRNIFGYALDLVPAIWAFVALVVVAAAVALLVQALAQKQVRLAPLSAAVLIVVVCVFFARIGFYGLFMSMTL